MDKAAVAVVVILLVTAYFVFERRVQRTLEPSRPVAAQSQAAPAPAPAAPVPAQAEPASAEPAPLPAQVPAKAEPAGTPQPEPRPHRRRPRRPPARPEPDAPLPPAPSRVANAAPISARESAETPPATPAGAHIAEQMQPVARTPVLAPAPGGPAGPSVLNYVAYTARFLVLSGARMRSYATFPVGTESVLYTHGLAFGHQTQEFKNAVYLGFGTQSGGGSETLHRYELSWQFAWAPLGTEGLFNPHIGFRLGGMMAASDRFTGGSLKPGVLLAPQVGLDVQAGRHVVLTGALSYDANLGPDLGPDATLSGYAYELAAAARF